MKRFFNKAVIFLSFLTTALLFASCRNGTNTEKAIKSRQEEIEKKITKPPSGFFDTLKINSRSAIFYYPDSLQLEKIKAVTDKSIFDGSMHEYFYQFRNAKIILKKYWPDVRITEARNVRYLYFLIGDKNAEIIDLDKKNDAYGLFIFEPGKKPAFLDLTNAESEFGFYFSK